MNASGNTMVAPTFANVGVNGKFKLADLTVTGYDLSAWDGECWDGGCYEGWVAVQTLTAGGTIDKSYFWVDVIEGEDEDPTSEENDVRKGWYKTDDGINYVKMTDEDMALAVFDQGQAFWICSTIDKSISLVPSGAVGTSDIEFSIIPGGNTAVGNARPTQIELGELTVSGYGKSEWAGDCWDGGCFEGWATLQTLTAGGSIDKSYCWVDVIEGENEDPESEENDVRVGWYKTEDGINYIKVDDAELKSMVFGYGKGFWFQYTQSDGNVKLNIPAVELK